MPVRAIRGATQLSADDAAEMSDAVVELLQLILERNELAVDDVISVVFTATADLVSGFPAAPARLIGFGDIPLLCAAELSIPGALPRVIRVMMHVNIDRPRDQVQHVYVRGAEALRQDLAQ